MAVNGFLKKYKKDLIRAVCALVLCTLAALFVFAFGKGYLPYSEDGDAFDTIYAVEENP